MKNILFAWIGLMLFALTSQAETFCLLRGLSECTKRLVAISSECTEKVYIQDEATALSPNIAFCWQVSPSDASSTNFCGMLVLLPTNGTGRVRSFVDFEAALVPGLRYLAPELIPDNPWGFSTRSYSQHEMRIIYEPHVKLYRADQEKVLRSGCVSLSIPSATCNSAAAEDGGGKFAVQQLGLDEREGLVVAAGVIGMFDRRTKRWFEAPQHGAEWRLLEYAIRVFDDKDQLLKFSVSHRICVIDGSFSPSYSPLRTFEFRDCDTEKDVPLLFQCGDAPKLELKVLPEDHGHGWYYKMFFSSEGFNRELLFSVEDAKSAWKLFKSIRE